MSFWKNLKQLGGAIVGGAVGFVLGGGPVGAIKGAILGWSMGYQLEQQEKAKQKAEDARKAAAAAEDARKGFEIAVEGEISVLPLVYGRAKIGGVRAFHGTISTFVDALKNDNVTSLKTGTLKTTPENNHNFLLFQQALCKREISSVYDVIIDDSRLLTDPDLGEVKDGDYAAMRIDVHNGQVIEACNLAKANFNRENAKFPNSAYATVVTHINRNAPQFNGVPNISFFVEGCRVKDVVNGILQEPLQYTNNPSLVLLDYLTVEKGIPLSNIDLASFEAAKLVCENEVQANIACGGLVWNSTNDSRKKTKRNLPLYEANLIIDTAKPFRENVQIILSTMGDARLVWSQGKYKLSLKYLSESDLSVPENIVDVIDDDRLVLGKEITITYPGSDQRLNHATVRFANEAENFKNDTASWPDKVSGSYVNGVGTLKYTPRSGWDNTLPGAFLNEYAVWEKNVFNAQQNFTWRIKPNNPGLCTLKRLIDPGGSIVITNETNPGLTIIISGENNFSGGAIHESTFTINTTNDVWKIVGIASATSDPDRAGFAATLTAASGNQIWTSREPSYTAFIDTNKNTEVYDKLMLEDNNIELETDIFLEGCTDYYHALAKAEELVRMSRTAAHVSFTYFPISGHLPEDTCVYPEPGDLLKAYLFSNNTEFIYVRLDKIDINVDGTLHVEGTKFLAEQLAWNVKDSFYESTASNSVETLLPPLTLVYSPLDSKLSNTSGTLFWVNAYNPNVDHYEISVAVDENYDNFSVIGNSVKAPFDVLDLKSKYAQFGIVSVTKSGSKSQMRKTGIELVNKTILGVPSNLIWDPTDMFSTGIGTLRWTKAIDATKYDVEYKLSSESEFGTTISIKEVFCEFPKIFEGVFDFRVRSRDENNSISDWVYLLDQNVTLLSVPDVTGLTLLFSADGINFESGDAIFSWTPILKSDTWFDSYEIRIYSYGETNPKITENVFENKYTLPYWKNDSYHVGRHFKIEVRIQGKSSLGGVLSQNANFLVVNNPPPDMHLVTPTVTAAASSLDVDWTQYTVESDVISLRVCWNTEDNFTSGFSFTDQAPIINRYYIQKLLPNTAYYVKIFPYDIFGVGTGTTVPPPVSTIKLEKIDINLELSKSILMTDSKGTSAESLEYLYDRNTTITGLIYNSNEWLEYEFGLIDYIDKVIVNTISTGQVHIEYQDDKSLDWHPLYADATNSVADGLQTSGTSYWQLINGRNVAMFPNRIVARKCRLIITGGPLTLSELVFSRIVIAEEIAVDNLAAITETVGVLYSDKYLTNTTEPGFMLNGNNGVINLRGVSMTFEDPSTKTALQTSLQITPGATVNNFKPSWTTGINYIVGDIVPYKGSSWGCIQLHTSSIDNAPISGSAYWMLFSEKGEKGTTGDYTKYDFGNTIDGPWYDAPPVSGDVWMRKGVCHYDSDTPFGGWETAVQLNGSNGYSLLAHYANGATAPSSGWTLTPSGPPAGSYTWMQTSSDGGTTWSGAVRVTGEKGNEGGASAPPEIINGNTPPIDPSQYQMWFCTASLDGTYLVSGASFAFYANTLHQFIGTHWVPKSPRGTKIGTDGIYTGLLTATQVDAINIDAAQINAGKLSANFIDTTEITSLGAVTAGSFNLGSGKFQVSANGDVTIKSSNVANSARLEITADCIKVFDGTNLFPRVLIGNLGA